MANPIGQVLLNTAKNVKEKREAKKQAQVEKQRQDAKDLTEKLINEPYKDPLAPPEKMPKDKELTAGEKWNQNIKAAELAEADRKKNAEAFAENPLKYTANEVIKPAVEKGVENLKDNAKEATQNASTSMKDAVKVSTPAEIQSNPEPSTQPSNANMTFNELADKLGIDSNNPTPEGQAALKEWLAANPDYKAGELTNAYLNGNTNGNNSNTELPYEDFQNMLRDYKKEYALPKNGADYLKSLWKEGKGGKAKAIGNVLGNLLGAGGYGLAGKEYSTDWEDYKNKYLEEASRREGEQFDRASGLTQRMFENRQDVDKMIDSLDKEVMFAKNLSEADKLAWTSFKQAQNAGDWKTILTMLATGKLGKIGNMVENWWNANATGNPMSMFNQGAK